MIERPPSSAPLQRLAILAALAFLFSGCSTPDHHTSKSARNYFVGLVNFSGFTVTSDANGDTVLLSPEISAPILWNELVVSWNVQPGVSLKIEARAFLPGHSSQFYTLGLWSDDSSHPRQSVNHQADPDGDVLTDTLVLKQFSRGTQLRLTLAGKTNRDALKLLGLSFCNSRARSVARQPNTNAWGRALEVPERVQSGYEGPGGWCSPASVSMVLAYWSQKLNRPGLNRPVPEVAAAVNDPVYGGTGNWPFNAAFAGGFPGMRALVTRLNGIPELEDCLAAGIPVVLSVSSYLTENRSDGPDNGHLIVCVGFDEHGGVVCNDPGVSLKRGESVRRVYPRDRLAAAWKKSKNAVYLIAPDSMSLPLPASGFRLN